MTADDLDQQCGNRETTFLATPPADGFDVGEVVGDAVGALVGDTVGTGVGPAFTTAFDVSKSSMCNQYHGFAQTAVASCCGEGTTSFVVSCLAPHKIGGHPAYCVETLKTHSQNIQPCNINTR